MNDKGNINESDRLLFTEAPASWKIRYVTPDGFECQITLRAMSGQELLEKYVYYLYCGYVFTVN
jgi:hypothetical protein